MLKYLLLSPFILILSYSFSIQIDEPTSIKDYYFPYEELFQPKIYKFVDKENPENIIYWYMYTKIINGDTTFITDAYDPDFFHNEVFMEKVTPTGLTLTRFTMINREESIQTIVQKDEIYNWEQNKKDTLTWSVIYDLPYGKESFSKKRTFVGSCANKTIEGKSYPTIQFKDFQRHYAVSEDWANTTDFYQDSYYCKGIGLVEYKRIIPQEAIYHFCLEKIYTKEAWDALVKTKK